MKKLLLLLSLVALAFSSHADTREVFNVYQKSKVIFTTEAALVDSVALEEDKTMVSLYRKDGTRLFSTSPAKLKQDGIMGLDYEQNYYLEHPEWIDQAHKLGMNVNVWTVNDEGAILKFNNMGVDYITTDIPVEAERIRHIYADQQGE